jgi:hypothetical protein
VPEAANWDDLAQASYYRHLPDSITVGARKASTASGAAATWPALRPGEKNILFVSLINETTLPAFRVHVAVVRSDDAEETSALLLGSAIAQCPMPFDKLARLGHRQNASLDHALTRQRAEEALADAKSASLGLPGTGHRRTCSSPGSRIASPRGAAGADSAPLSAEAAKQVLEELARSEPLELSAQELEQGREAAQSVQAQACTLMKCAHDAIVEHGLTHAVELFKGGLELREAVGREGYTVHGCTQAHRGLFACLCGAHTIPWTYEPPLEDEGGSKETQSYDWVTGEAQVMQYLQ